MSIEALIQAHTAALEANTEAVKLLTLSLAGRTPKAEKAVTDKIVKEVAETKLVSEVKSVKGTTAAEAVADEILGKKSKTGVAEGVTEEKDPEDVPVSYETVRTLVLKLAPTQRQAIKALNAKHGIANLKVLLDKEDDFSTVNDQEKLEAVYVDLQNLEG
jgi:hypothetical protein